MHLEMHKSKNICQLLRLMKQFSAEQDKRHLTTSATRKIFYFPFFRIQKKAVSVAAKTGESKARMKKSTNLLVKTEETGGSKNFDEPVHFQAKT